MGASLAGGLNGRAPGRRNGSRFGVNSCFTSRDPNTTNAPRPTIWSGLSFKRARRCQRVRAVALRIQAMGTAPCEQHGVRTFARRFSSAAPRSSKPPIEPRIARIITNTEQPFQERRSAVLIRARRFNPRLTLVSSVQPRCSLRLIPFIDLGSGIVALGGTSRCSSIRARRHRTPLDERAQRGTIPARRRATRPACSAGKPTALVPAGA